MRILFQMTDIACFSYLNKSRFIKLGCLSLFATFLIFIIFYLVNRNKTTVYENVTFTYTPEQLALGIKLDTVTSCLQKVSPETLFALHYEENDPYGYEGQNRFSRMLSIYNNLMSSLLITTAIIEPSMLFCMLIPAHKQLLVKHGYNKSSLEGSWNIITYGMHEDDIYKLQMESGVKTFRQGGFQVYFERAPAADWMLLEGKLSAEDICSHVFYTYYEFIIHVVVFYKRSNFLWHAGIDAVDKVNIPIVLNLLFVDHPSAYEKFAMMQLPTTTEEDFFIPSNPAHFLFQISSSRFLECNRKINDKVNYKNNLYKTRSGMSVEEFNDNTRVAIQSLKRLLHPLLMNFWIFSGTLLGWYRECGIIQHTTDVDFGVWASELEDLDRFISLTLNNTELSLDLRMGVVDEALELRLKINKLQVDLFFLYQIKNGSWMSGHNPSRGYYFRYYYPPFTLCSAELLNEKVQVPCQAENLLVAEYGPKWIKPVSSWNFESSIKNRGPNIYWITEKRKLSFAEY